MSSNGSGGWLNTKKRGKDDAQIVMDAAEEKRRRQNEKRIKQGKPPKAGTTTEAKKMAAKKKNAVKAPRPRTKYEEDEDYTEDGVSDGHGMDDFIVGDEVSEEEEEADFDSDALPSDNDDGDELVEDDEEDDEEEDEKLHASLNDDNDDEDNGDSSDEEVSFMGGGTMANRPSRPSGVLRQNAKIAKSARASPLSMQAHSKQKEKKRRRSTESLVNVQQANAKKTRKQQSRHAVQAVAKREQSHIGDDDDEVEIITSPDVTPKNNHQRSQIASNDEEQYDDILEDAKANDTSVTLAINGPVRSRYFQDGNADSRSGSDDLADTPTPLPRNKKKLVIKKSTHYPEDEESEGDDNVKQVSMESSLAGFASASHATNDFTDSDDEGLQQAMKASMENTSSKGVSGGGMLRDSDDDDDEDMRAAKKLSLKTLKRKSKREAPAKLKRGDESVAEDHTVELLESSDDDEDGPEVEYVSKEQRAATEILKTAEQLSAQVFAAMKSWTNEKNSSDSDTVLQGIISDGAVSLGNISAAAISQDHRWITSEAMQAICPNVRLSEYQLVGVNWMALLDGMTCDVGVKGDTTQTRVNGVLADEMGLGKTVQTIAFLAYLKHRSNLNQIGKDENETDLLLPHLVIVPVSVLKNWMNEIEKWCPDLSVECYHGTQEEREDIRNQLEEHIPKNSKKRRPSHPLDAIIAPSTYFSKESSEDRKFLCRFNYSYLVVDEAHILKSATSTRYQQLNKVKAEHRLLLTGTPVQNSPRELLNMLSFLMPLFSRPGMFGEKESIVDELLEHFVDEKKGGGLDNDTAYKKLKQVFAPFVLRRKKEDVLSQLLPPKKREVRMVELDDDARRVYDSIIQSHLEKNGSKVTAAIGEHLFTNLRKAAHHSLLLRTRHTSPEEIDHLVKYFMQTGAFQGEGATAERVKNELARWNDFTIHVTALDLVQENDHRRKTLGRYILDKEALYSSAKFRELRTLVPNLVGKGHRILIFSSWTSCLDLLGCLMENLDLKFLRMDGSTPGDERQKLIDRFNRDDSFNVFLLSTKACGLGINLTAADTCIIHDLDFNPFNDLQAEDRCHRIGQKKTVTVYKLVTKNTVDEDIYRMQEKKVIMNAAIMDSKSLTSDKKLKKELLQSEIDRVRERTKAPPPAGNKENKSQGQDAIVIE